MRETRILRFSGRGSLLAIALLPVILAILLVLHVAPPTAAHELVEVDSIGSVFDGAQGLSLPGYTSYECGGPACAPDEELTELECQLLLIGFLLFAAARTVVPLRPPPPANARAALAAISLPPAPSRLLLSISRT